MPRFNKPTVYFNLLLLAQLFSWQNDPIGAILAEAATIIGAVGALAAAASAVSSFTRKTPKAPGAVQAPDEADVHKGDAELRRRRLAARGFRANLISDFARADASPGLKTTLGA